MRVSSRITAKAEESPKVEEPIIPKPEKPKKPKVESPKKVDETKKEEQSDVVDPNKEPSSVPDSTVTTETGDKKVENGDAEMVPKKEEPKPKKPIKKTIPLWATLDGSRLNKPQAKQTTQNAMDVIQEAIKETGNAKGVASALAIKRYVKKKCPSWPKMTFKKSLLKSIEKGRVIQVTGKGISGSFKNAPPGKVSKQVTKGGKKVAAQSADMKPLEDLFPNIFTWVCEPKEASFQLIRKYIAKHHPKLDTEGKNFKKAVELAVAKGQLDRITGQASSGTFQLVDGAKKTGNRYEDAIEDAIIAMNEPKDASIPALRHYLSEYHLEYNIEKRPLKLKSALERCEAKGWIKRLTGKGFSGSYRLAFPYHPNPRDLWGEWYEEEEESEPKPKRSKKKYQEESSDDEEEDSSSESEFEAEIIPIKKKRSAPSARSNSTPKKKVIKVPVKKPSLKKKARR